MEKKKKKRITWVELKQYIPLYVMLLPACIYFFINNYIPMPGIIVAFKKYSKRKGIYGSAWNGLDNFRYLFKSDAGLIIRNTLLYNIVFIILGMVAGVAVSNPDHRCLFQKNEKSVSERDLTSIFDFHCNCQLYRICFLKRREWND